MAIYSEHIDSIHYCFDAAWTLAYALNRTLYGKCACTIYDSTKDQRLQLQLVPLSGPQLAMVYLNTPQLESYYNTSQLHHGFLWFIGLSMSEYRYTHSRVQIQ